MARKLKFWENYRSYWACFFINLFFLEVLILSGCDRKPVEKEVQPKPDEDVARTILSAPMPWLYEPAARWKRDFSGSRRDSLIPVPKADLEKAGIGIKTSVYALFDRWRLNDDIRGNRCTHYAEITGECKGMIELDFALTQEEWQSPENRVKYYRAVERLINRIGNTLLTDLGNKLEDQEKELFLRALKTLAWQESEWQHYLRYRDWFFVVVSSGSYNKLHDWGITQIARSSFDPKILLNKNFFDSKAYCSISSSLYYGFMEYYYCYMEARENPDNGSSLFNKIVGAYNRYCSGYSSSYCELAKNDKAYRNYQIRAMGGFKDNFILKPWERLMNLENEE
ncbi:hypothetical protein CH333_01270 [candidate division WOR-3 bacterium JGI_Cruoil_03_44_89]|uniref:Uncharacterized protein n=1 Tax=candidate division WOR-3 bacterium JGI_Cruoil_03_44_89 TaxID=1973748 RepID=A0A235BYP6_UNCW3|nr:MAG: hypothetical protein CH333_01270 [candidate division WOR-3 bacterium JGI_Cruoil_03_44_89]